MPDKHRWSAALLSLVVVAGAWGAEPTPSAVQAMPDQLAPSIGFDLKSESVRNLVRAAAATQSGSNYRIEPAPRQKQDLAAILRERPASPPPREKARPRLPERPPPCDGFISCGIESLLGLEDFDDELYDRVARHRLMNQGSFTDSSKINASVGMPNPSAGSSAGPLRPRQP